MQEIRCSRARRDFGLGQIAVAFHVLPPQQSSLRRLKESHGPEKYCSRTHSIKNQTNSTDVALNVVMK